MITDEEAQQLMCPPSPQILEEEIQPKKRLQRMNSFHVGPVQLPHPVRMPNGRARNNSADQRASSEDYSLKMTPGKFPNKKGLRSYSLKYGTTLEDYSTIIEKPSAAINLAGSQERPKIKTVPLYRPKRSSKRMSEGSCHIAIEEMATNSHSSKFLFIDRRHRRIYVHCLVFFSSGDFQMCGKCKKAMNLQV